MSACVCSDETGRSLKMDAHGSLSGFFDDFSLNDPGGLDGEEINGTTKKHS